MEVDGSHDKTPWRDVIIDIYHFVWQLNATHSITLSNHPDLKPLNLCNVILHWDGLPIILS